MSNVLIIVTSASTGYIYNEFEKKFSPSENNGVLKAEIHSNEIFVINKDKASNCEESVKKNINSSLSSDIFICAHTGYIGKDKLSQEVIVFRHNDDIGQELLKFAQKEISFDDMWGYLEKKRVNYPTANLLHLFLPLDIDFQALQATTNFDGFFHEMYTNLEKLYKSEEYKDRKSDEHYRQKLYDLWHFLGKKDYLRQIGKKPSSKVENVAPIDNPSPSIQQLAGLSNGNPKESPIYQFLKALDERKKDGNDLKEEVDYLLTPFKFIELKIGDDEINSFQDWYCALDSCLREAEGCEGN